MKSLNVLGNQLSWWYLRFVFQNNWQIFASLLATKPKIIVLVGCILKSKRKTHFGGDNKCSIKWHCVHHTRFHTRAITYKYLLILFALIRFFKLRIFCVLSLPENHLLWTPLLVIVKIEQKHWKYQPCASACDGNNFFIKILQDNDNILI